MFVSQKDFIFSNMNVRFVFLSFMKEMTCFEVFRVRYNFGYMN